MKELILFVLKDFRIERVDSYINSHSINFKDDNGLDAFYLLDKYQETYELTWGLQLLGTRSIIVTQY